MTHLKGAADLVLDTSGAWKMLCIGPGYIPTTEIEMDYRPDSLGMITLRIPLEYVEIASTSKAK